ncbi:hypothetical protein [Vibrio tapetis]|uniref:Uncharacterized protein n=1 Tax=Vibrio tapetis subsp. tapetis TaxID=1671868 RepID=A0A2N8ZLU6_9VIBR|nr:hypothetical protein [Vibrio tapetis]SON52856.1 conserved exported protein of unknown function [Vibrio tapetis subsp. tapetis]
MMRLIFFIITCFSFFVSLPTLSSDDFHFTYLNEKIVTYSEKITICNSKKEMPLLSGKDLKHLKEILGRKPLILSYLSMKSFNNCLQPERGELAELLLSYDYVDISSYTRKLANSTKKLVFLSDFDELAEYTSLNHEEKRVISTIEELKAPFDELGTFEFIMEM